MPYNRRTRGKKGHGRPLRPRPLRPRPGLQECDCNSSAPNQGCSRGYYCKGMTTTGRCTCVKR